MSVLNLGLQGVALTRQEMPKDNEKVFKRCSGMSAAMLAANDHYKATVVVDVAAADENVDIDLGVAASNESGAIDVMVAAVCR
jgi:hypothetical protein